ncbi:MAG: hydrolase [Sphingobacteriales bacterium]|nr:MAG: hydrolase [Sphingobacteriales bacterium]
MYPVRVLVFTFFSLAFSALVSAQGIVKVVPSYHIEKTTSDIKIDGLLDEDVWQKAQRTSKFYQTFPADTSYAKSHTEVQLTFDEKNLYISAVCYESVAGKYIIPSLRRDFAYPRSDAFAIYLDPSNDKTNGFNFTISPLGVQREGLITNGGIQGVTTNWDNKWFSAVKNYQDRWVVEIAIPFKTIRYNPAVSEWGLNLSRQDLKINENSSWAPVTRNFNVSTLGFAGKLVWTKPPPPAGSNFSIIPYIRANYSDKNIPEFNKKRSMAAGGDIKIGITSSLNLDITVNPDFSESEVDQQVINLDRFSIFFPERRNFFLENSDLFASFGFSQIRPFNSRNIGLNKGQVVPILAGARLSGKIDQNWRLGVMSIQTSANEEIKLLSQNYTVSALQRKVGKASNIGAIFVNRQAYNKGLSDNNYNRLAGLDYNFANPKNTWRGRVFYHYTFDAINKINPFAHASWLMHVKRKYEFHWNHEYVGKGYNAEVGFVPRKAYWRLEPSANYYMYPKNTIINRMGPQLYLSLYTKDDDVKNVTDNYWRGGYKFEFQNTASFGIYYDHFFVKLLYPFDISGINQPNKHPLGNYSYGQTRVNFTSNYRKLFNYELYMQYGNYYTGQLFSYSASFSYRWQPYMTMSINAYRTEIYLPDPYKNAYHTIIGPRVDFSFSKSLFFNTWLQYNAQAKNININSRLQWRFRPMSDLYIVYNKNWQSVQLDGLNQALIVKLNWWLNL